MRSDSLLVSIWSVAGRTWQPIFDNERAASIGALTVAPSAPSTLYVGTARRTCAPTSPLAQACINPSMRANTGPSSDSPRPADRPHLLDPRDPEVVFVAALGHAYGPNAERGVFRSRDGGAQWSKVLFETSRHGSCRSRLQAWRPGYDLCGAVADQAPTLECLSTVERSRERSLCLP